MPYATCRNASAVALELLRVRGTEDKLAGMIWIQEILVPGGVLDSKAEVSEWARLFDQGHVADWNVCDWFCVKVLGPLIAREGRPMAEAIGNWRTAPSLWRRRASAVAFVNLAKKGDDFFAGFTKLVLRSCDALLRDQARFSQTGAGWVLRELARSDPEGVAAFVRDRKEQFSKETFKSATKGMSADAVRASRGARDLPHHPVHGRPLQRSVA